MDITSLPAGAVTHPVATVSLPTAIDCSVLAIVTFPADVECLPVAASGGPASIASLPAGIECRVLTIESFPAKFDDLPAEAETAPKPSKNQYFARFLIPA